MNTIEAMKIISAERRRRGWSIMRLAAKSGLSLHGIHRMEHFEKYRNTPRLESIEKLCSALEISMDSLREAC